MFAHDIEKFKDNLDYNEFVNTMVPPFVVFENEILYLDTIDFSNVSLRKNIICEFRTSNEIDNITCIELSFDIVNKKWNKRNDTNEIYENIGINNKLTHFLIKLSECFTLQ